MFGLDNASGVSVMPPIAPKANQNPRWFSKGGVNQPATYPGQDWFNEVQSELLNVLAEASVAPDKTKLNQLAGAIRTIAQTAAPVGIPQPWPQATPPAGWLICNGSVFNKAQYPELAKAYPSGVLPDLRGEFIRGWDNGRGVDAGRGLSSTQLDAFQRHRRDLQRSAGGSDRIHGMVTVARGTDFAVPVATTGGDTWYTSSYLESGDGAVRVSAETRPRNVAFNYIVRAA